MTDLDRALIVGLLPLSAMALFTYCAGWWRFTAAGRRKAQR